MTIAGLIVAGILRVVWYSTFWFLHPFVVHVINFFVDDIDFEAWLLATGGEDRAFYDRWDKAFDLGYYISAILFLSWFADQLWYAKWVLPFLVYRVFGNIVFLITLDYLFLEIFPNVFSLLFFYFTALDFWGIDS